MDIDSLTINSSVRLTTEKSSFEGLVLPSECNEIVLKLNSGYNVGLLKKNITKIEKLAIHKKDVSDVSDKKQDRSLPKVMILHTGGTIASKVDYETGGVVASFDPKELLSLFPELAKLAFIESELVGNMQSEDFRFAHFNLVAKKVFEHAKKGFSKFIVTSGTDMLHFMSSALSFMLKDVPVSVLVVGSQRSSDRGSSDASMNLACATNFLVHNDFMGVHVCMHASISDDECVILSGVNVRKMHSSRRDAFKPINGGPLAKINYVDKKITLFDDLKKISAGLPKNILLLREDVKVGMLYAKPNMFPEEFSAYKQFDGLVLVGSGLGHMPITKFDDFCAIHLKIKDEVIALTKNMPVVMALQTIYGRVDMDVYSPGRTLQELGVLGNGSLMSPETAYIKLAWLISNFDKDKVKDLFMQDLVGELNESKSNLYW